MSHAKLIVALVIAVLILIVIFQNMDTVTARFLFFSVSMPMALAMIIDVAAGFIIGFLVALFYKRSRPAQ
jgi:uncharacterized integral membrane protein